MIRCEKCKERESTVLVIEEPDWPFDPVAGWFKCDECHALDPDGWTYVLDAKEFGDTSKPVPSAPPGGKPRAGGHPAIDEDWIVEAHLRHCNGASLTEIAHEAMQVRSYKNIDSAREAMRRNFMSRGMTVYSARRQRVAA